MERQTVIKPPQNPAQRKRYVRKKEVPYVFLAGSIEMGAAEDWQTVYTEKFTQAGYGVFNPRRDDWDASWVQNYESPQFYQQVTWELGNINIADIVVMRFASGTQSPISLLELGIIAGQNGFKEYKDRVVFVICPEDFWRYGNVQVTCDYFGIPLYNTDEEFFNEFGL